MPKDSTVGEYHSLDTTPQPSPKRLMLPPEYYRHNFELIVKSVVERDRHLLWPAELRRLEDILSLPGATRGILVRLFNRRGSCFRLDRLSYAEIPNIPENVQILAQYGLVRVFGVEAAGLVHPHLDSSEVFDTFNVAELATVAGLVGLVPTGRAIRRSAWLELLRTRSDQEVVTALLRISPLLKLEVRPLLRLIEVLFFLNTHQNSTTLVTSDLSLIRFPAYRVWRTRAVFHDRPGLDAWLVSNANREELERLLLEGELARADTLGEQAISGFLASPRGQGGFLDRFTSRYVDGRAAARYIEACETRLGAEKALQLYGALLLAGLPGRARARVHVRTALLTERQHGPLAAVKACDEALSESSTRGGERQDLQLRRERLIRRLERRQGRVPGKGTAADDRKVAFSERVIYGRVKSSSTGHPMLIFSGELTPLRVEEFALHAYRSAGLTGVYGENHLITTLSALLYWDILFAPVPDVFQSAYQDSPLDLLTDEFAEQRKELLLERASALRMGDLSFLAHNYVAHRGEMARGVAWETFSLQQLEAVASALGGVVLEGICGWLFDDYRHRSRGLPDLLLWKGGQAHDLRETSAHFNKDTYEPPAAVFFAEVKSERDRLRPEQRAWLERFAELGVWVEVCHVRAQGQFNEISNTR